MTNMSYCRFENTSIALDECLYAIQDMYYSKEIPLSDEEYYYFKKLFEQAQEYIDLYEKVKDFPRNEEDDE